MTLRLIARSSNLAVSVEELAEHLRRSDTEEEDAYIETCGIAAEQAVEDYTGLALRDQTWDYYLDDFPDVSPLGTNWWGWPYASSVYLPKPPLLEVLSVNYRDSGGVAQTFGNYLVEGGSGDRPSPARLYLPINGSWPDVDGQPNACRIRFRCGFADDSASPPPSVEGEIPAIVKACIKLYAGSLYAQREGSAPDKRILEMLRGYRMDTSIG